MANMYTPDVFNISSGWYRTTTEDNYAPGRDYIDQHWNSHCDELLTSYVEKYGAFFPAYAEELVDEIDSTLETEMKGKGQYYMYYIRTRAYELETTRQIWIDSCQANEGVTYSCPYCEKTLPLLDCQEDMIKRFGLHPPHCRDCNWIVSCTRSWSDSLGRRFTALMRTFDEKRECNFCGKTYGFGPSKRFTHVDYLVPCVVFLNLVAQICPRCYGRIERDYKKGTAKQRLTRLRDACLVLGAIPYRNVGIQSFLEDADAMREAIRILTTLRTEKGYKDEHGSYFAALVRAGVYPEGTKRTTFGTMTLAVDGHTCLSLVEKDIDDFMHARGIRHAKEVYYPGTRFRADWELLDAETRTFVEYFGLMSRRDYAERACQKRSVAAELGIDLIEIYPNTEWRSRLSVFAR